VVNPIRVDADTAEWARVALQRMLDITAERKEHGATD
jgi:quinolinate synthase